MRRLIALLLLILVCFPLYLSLPLLWSDATNIKGWRPAIEMQVASAKCLRHMFVVSMCTLQYKSLLNPDEKPVSLEYLVVGGSWGGEKFALLASEDDGHVTSTVGVGHLTHRIISAAIWLAIVIFFAYGATLRKKASPESEAPAADGVSIAIQNAVNAAAAQARPAADNSSAGLRARARLNGDPMNASSGPRTFGRRTS